MQAKTIVFTAKERAELLDREVRPLGAQDVRVKTRFSTISCGTERANITANPNVATVAPPQGPEGYFPRVLGYSSSGVVEETGSEVTSVKAGDRVAMFWSQHTAVNVIPESKLLRLEDNVTMEDAAIAHIATFPMAAIRKTRLEIGESALIMGQGPLGQLAVQIARAAGAVPVIAVDPVASRREAALALGADYALDPTLPDFARTVKELTHGGANIAIEVTGVGKGLDQALDCMANFGRVALLGCTRDKEFTIDYYRKVHAPGITLIGAHTLARPSAESHPGWFTTKDDLDAILRLCAGGRMNLRQMVGEVHAPADCPEVYTRLVHDRNFPAVVLFDWDKL